MIRHIAGRSMTFWLRPTLSGGNRPASLDRASAGRPGGPKSRNPITGKPDRPGEADQTITSALKGNTMTEFKVNPEFIITDEGTLRGLFQATHELAILKCQDTLGEHAQAFIARSPFVCIGTQRSDGEADVSPRGDPAGFVKILDEHTLAIPDRPGNNRLDTLVNIVENPSVGLLFLIPGFDDTMRVNGQASLVTDPELLQSMAVNDRIPKLAIVVRVNEVFIHCAKALRRARLWDPDQIQDRGEMPSLIKIILDQTKGAPTDENEMRKLDDGLEESYKKTLY